MMPQHFVRRHRHTRWMDPEDCAGAHLLAFQSSNSMSARWHPNQGKKQHPNQGKRIDRECEEPLCRTAAAVTNAGGVESSAICVCIVLYEIKGKTAHPPVLADGIGGHYHDAADRGPWLGELCARFEEPHRPSVHVAIDGVRVALAKSPDKITTVTNASSIFFKIPPIRQRGW